MAGHRHPRAGSVRQNRLILSGIGFMMGIADIIPGISGGTVAFIAGIYEQLLASITGLNHLFVKKVLALDIRGALAQIRAGFLVPLLCGILLSLLLMSRIIHWLLQGYKELLLSFFLGLVSASILVVVRRLPPWNAGNAAFLVLGFLVAFVLAGIIPRTTPQTLWFLFLCGSVAICAMILPGISGAFILLLLGKYEFITGVLKNPFSLEHLQVIVVFGAGCVTGLVLFSRVLRKGLTLAYGPTMSLLTGFMAGAMRKLWPWKKPVPATGVDHGAATVHEYNVLPPEVSGEVVLAALLFLAGFLLILALEMSGAGSKKKDPQELASQ